MRHFALLTFFLYTSLGLFSQSNQYLHLDGIDDHAVVPDAAQYVAGAEGVTMAAWFYTDELVYGQGMLSIRGGGSGDGEMYVIQLSDGVLECRFISSNGFHEVVVPAGNLQAQTWTHLAWVFTGSELTLYLDGNDMGSTSASGVVESLDRPFAIGKSIQSGFNFVFGGRVDEVSLWSRGLTAEEITDMMENELEGDELGLELYFKMNQGVPGQDNTSITQLISEVGDGTRNADLINFSLIGEESNFNGVLEDGFQSISFPQLPDVLISAPPITLEAMANSGLPVDYSIVSGPATVEGNIVTLDGTPGQVTVRASQVGNDDYEPAVDVNVTFSVIDPSELFPNIEIRNPVEGDFYASTLQPIQLASIVDVDYPDLFSITDILYEVDGVEVAHSDYGNRHQTAWWTPSTYGEHTLEVTATHNEGSSYTQEVVFTITNEVTDLSVPATVDIWADADNFSVEAEAVLPSYQSAFDHIQGMLAIDCPPGGCDPWDRVSSMEVKGHDGEWYEIIRYLTPYGIACDHEIVLTDFMSLLQGKVRFRVNLGTQGNGFLYSLTLDYQAGVPQHPYSVVNKLWYQTYAFGDLADLQPTENFIVQYPVNTMDAKLKVVSSGHGWGDNNTGNAAEFHHDIHNIWVNGEETFEQDNWYDCNPNPDGCNGQFGTWYFDRAGWCPGSIAQFFDYEMGEFTSDSQVDLRYIFDTDYVDYCHPSNPDCVSGVTCPDCSAGFNPHLIVTSYLISLGDVPIEPAMLTVGLDEVGDVPSLHFNLFPNPSAGRFILSTENLRTGGVVTVFSMNGSMIARKFFSKSSETLNMDLGDVPNGIYIVKLDTEEGSGIQKLVIE